MGGFAACHGTSSVLVAKSELRRKSAALAEALEAWKSSPTEETLEAMDEALTDFREAEAALV